jgi:hypothetical protein
MSAWLPVAAGAGSLLGGLFGGGGAEQRPMNTGITNPEQVALLRRMIEAYGQGSGEFGFGPAAQSGYATLSGLLGGRGIGMGSGVAQSALSQMMSQAMTADSQNRQNYGMNLVGAGPGSLFNYDRLGVGTSGLSGGANQGLFGVLQSILRGR